MHSPWYRHIPNTLTAIRFVLAFALPFFPQELRLEVVVVALLTEFLDGYTARKLNAVTSFGQLFDPVADKLFIVSAVIVLLVDSSLSLTHLALICVRDFVVSVGSAVLLALHGRGVLKQFRPRNSGKVTTALQFAFLMSLFLGFDPSVGAVLLYFTAVASAVSAVDYLHAGSDLLSSGLRLRATTDR